MNYLLNHYSASEPHLYLRVDLKPFSESRDVEVEEWEESSVPEPLPSESRQARLQGLIMNQVGLLYVFINDLKNINNIVCKLPSRGLGLNWFVVHYTNRFNETDFLNSLLIIVKRNNLYFKRIYESCRSSITELILTFWGVKLFVYLKLLSTIYYNIACQQGLGCLMAGIVYTRTHIQFIVKEFVFR